MTTTTPSPNSEPIGLRERWMAENSPKKAMEKTYTTSEAPSLSPSGLDPTYDWNHQKQTARTPEPNQLAKRTSTIDPWAHRSAKMLCSTCMWFVEKGELGRCRRHAPALGGYPVVFAHDWCGDHKLDETKF